MNTVLGAPAIRDMAARAPYRPLKLHPIGAFLIIFYDTYEIYYQLILLTIIYLVSVATNISKELLTVSPDIAPPSGFIFCGNQPLRVLGIPYFVEGPFIQGTFL